MKKYVYFVTFAHPSGLNIGFGQSEIIRSEPITKKEDLDEIAAEYNKQLANSDFYVILNYILLREEGENNET